jgi:dolichol-phosphate mannosyltransferase
MLASSAPFLAVIDGDRKMSIKSNLSDPMSGFFMLRRSALNRCVRNLSGIGFKILIDLFASSPKPLKFKELPYEFRVRTAGESKLDSQAVWSYLMLLLDKLVGHLVPARFIAFCFVGGVGVFVHFSVLWALLMLSGGSFVTSHSIATVVWKWIQGWISFSIACSIGAITNVGIAAYLVGHNTEWPLAAFAGILVGTVWNYAATSIYTWRTPKSP